jgi:hypothetical protein
MGLSKQIEQEQQLPAERLKWNQSSLRKRLKDYSNHSLPKKELLAVAQGFQGVRWTILRSDHAIAYSARTGRLWSRSSPVSAFSSSETGVLTIDPLVDGSIDDLNTFCFSSIDSPLGSKVDSIS